MLGWVLAFLVIAIVAGVLGFGGLAGAASSIAQILFFVFWWQWLLDSSWDWVGERVDPVFKWGQRTGSPNQ